MGDMTRQEMVDETRLMLENRDSSDVPDSRIETWIDWSYKHVCEPSVFTHRELQDLQNLSFTTNLYTYSLDPAAVYVYSIFNITRGYRLKPREQRQVDSRRRTQGQPRNYSLWGTLIDVQPTPSSAYNGDLVVVRFLTEPTSLAAAGSTTVIPAVWDQVIVLGAVWRGWMALGRREQAEFAKGDYGQMIREIADRLRLDHFDVGFKREMVPEFANYQRISR